MRDYDVRVAVRKRLEAEHLGDANTRIVEEMNVWSGTVRIDVAVINGELCGYELKSDRDTLERLPLQIEVYGRVFDRVVLVVGARHVRKARQLIPRWWGVTIARLQSGEVILRDDRKAKTNPSIDPLIVADLLSKEEALLVLDKFGLAKGWRSKRIGEVHHRLATELPLDILREQVRETMKGRQEWLGQACPGPFDVTVNA